MCVLLTLWCFCKTWAFKTCSHDLLIVKKSSSNEMISRILPLFFLLPQTLLVTPVGSLHRSQQAELIGWPDSESVNWFCLSRHSDGLFFDSQVSHEGCQIQCIFLIKSKNIYYDHTQRYSHNLQDGAKCGNNQVCPDKLFSMCLSLLLLTHKKWWGQINNFNVGSFAKMVNVRRMKAKWIREKVFKLLWSKW